VDRKETTRKRILVDNPEYRYSFAKSARVLLSTLSRPDDALPVVSVSMEH
jgi:hypothetical protein